MSMASSLDMLLPRFMLRREDGVFVDLEQLNGSDDFQQVVERLFSSGAYFQGLDYALFVRLAYDFPPGAAAAEAQRRRAEGLPAELRLATAIARVLPSRVGLYKPFKAVRGEAEYLFEPLFIDIEIETPVYETDELGASRLVRTDRRTMQQQTGLDFDEFVAQMWLKGLRFGIDAAAVREAIASRHTGRLIVARMQPPTPGQDASVEQLSTDLHRDNAPPMRDDGRVDLTRFRNRFPQVRVGTPLMRKLPAVPGAPGRELNGTAIFPAAPRDFDFATLAGAGTRIGRDEAGEVLLATMDGFVDVDHQTNLIAVSEKIVNRDGVSMRTTGDLALMGDEFEEHGEIQEGRTVEGRSMTIANDVYGRLVSKGGTITVQRNLAGGTAINHDGPVIVEGLTARATIFATRGEVRLARAESSLIVARRVVVSGCAVGCDILAEDIEVAEAQGCAIGAPSVHIGIARSHGDTETLVSVRLPDLGRFARDIEAARERLATQRAALARLHESEAALRERPEVARYLLLANKIRAGEAALTAEQELTWRRFGTQIGAQLKELASLHEAAAAAEAEQTRLQGLIDALAAERDALGAAACCRIDAVEGGAIVRTTVVDAAEPPLAGQGAKEIRARLHSTALASTLLFAGGEGSFDWRWKPD